MVLMLDIGNTHTHFAVWNGRSLSRHAVVPTHQWSRGDVPAMIQRVCRAPSEVALCSVVPTATRQAQAALKRRWNMTAFELTHRTTRGVGIRYPRPQSIGPDRLANAVAAHQMFGAPAVVVDFGTAVTFDVIDPAGRYVGGIIAPGIAAMTEYLHDKTALLPRITLRDTRAVVGKSTREAMLIGAVHGYRGLVRELIMELKRELRRETLPVVATGGYAELIAKRLPEITSVDPLLTLRGLLRAWELWKQT